MSRDDWMLKTYHRSTTVMMRVNERRVVDGLFIIPNASSQKRPKSSVLRQCRSWPRMSYYAVVTCEI